MSYMTCGYAKIKEIVMGNTDDTYPPMDDYEAPLVDTVSIYKDGDDLTLTIDGVDSLVPGGNASVNLEEDGTVCVYLYATFKAHTVDLSGKTGS